MLKENIVSKFFDRSVQTYDLHNHIQMLIGKQLIKLIDKHFFENIIDLGCGTGSITKHLAESIKFNHLYALDISQKMLIQSQKKLAFFPHTIINSDFNHFSLPQVAFDLVFSNMALHWGADFSSIFKTIYSQLNNNAILAFSCPLSGTFHELPSLNRNAFYEDGDILSQLKNHQFHVIKKMNKQFVMTFENAYQALSHIKACGSNYVFKKNNLNNRIHFLKNYLRANIKPSLLTYHIGFYIAIKG